MWDVRWELSGDVNGIQVSGNWAAKEERRKGEPQSTNQDQVNSTFAEVKEKLDFGGRENFYYYFIIIFKYFLKKSSDCGDFMLKEDCVSARICLKSHR